MLTMTPCFVPQPFSSTVCCLQHLQQFPVCDTKKSRFMLFVGCLTSQQQASVSQGQICLTSQQHATVSQGQICSDNCTCSHTEIQVVDQPSYSIQSQYTDARPTSPSVDPISPAPGRVATGVPIFKSLL